MAKGRSRREILLILGFGLAAAFWLWRLWDQDAPPAATAAGKGGQAKKELAIAKAPLVHMELLDRAVVKYEHEQGGRDLFKYSVRPPSWAQVKQMRAAAAAAEKAQRQAESRSRLEALQRQKAEAERQEYLAAHPPPPAPPQPPTISFRFLGFVGPPTGRIAAFEENDATFVATTGEIVKKEFRVDEIKYESVVISYVDPRFKGQVRELPLMRGK
jgi:multidrug efflux pump subunit AcrA (membrane-fusion protein)